MQTIDYRRGLPAMAACFLIWGFQPLYWYMCTNVCGEIDTFFLMACRIIWDKCFPHVPYKAETALKSFVHFLHLETESARRLKLV